jgi:hypothetical protein
MAEYDSTPASLNTILHLIGHWEGALFKESSRIKNEKHVAPSIEIKRCYIDSLSTPGGSPHYPDLLVLAYTLSMFDRMILSILLPDIKAEFGLSDTQLRLLGGISFALFYATMGLPALLALRPGPGETENVIGQIIRPG